MFAQAQGATALRIDLVRALSFSVDVAELDTPDGCGRCCAAVGAVWNGRKGYVAVLIRGVDRPELRRYVFSDPVLSPESLAGAVDEGISFAESMGFTMDPPDFLELSAERRSERMDIWNAIRKPERALRHLEALREGAPGPEKRAVVPNREAVARWDLPPEAAPGAAESGSGSLGDSESGGEAAPEGAETPAAQPGGETPRRNVLGRLALVRRGDRERRAEPAARLLAFF